MRKLIPLKFFSMTLLLIMLITAINGVHDNAHAMPSQITAASEQSPSAADPAHSCPCEPGEQHKDCDGCDSCLNCSCHAPLTVQPFRIRYTPLIITLSSADLFKHLPEVFLPKFIPPQNRA